MASAIPEDPLVRDAGRGEVGGVRLNRPPSLEARRPTTWSARAERRWVLEDTFTYEGPLLPPTEELARPGPTDGVLDAAVARESALLDERDGEASVVAPAPPLHRVGLRAVLVALLVAGIAGLALESLMSRPGVDVVIEAPARP